MLTEHFIASIDPAVKTNSSAAQKDAAIFVHELQPLLQQRSIFKKSSTPANCLAFSDTHVFAAQTDKAVVHVYSRLKGSQEAIVPFPERITSLALACSDAILILGTAEGRILLWELASGRQVTTSQAHLQAVTALAVDSTSNFVLSASADSTVHVWSLPAFLSFTTIDVQALSPLGTFTNHRAEIVSLALGHSSSFCNVAVSVSHDKTCLVWDYHTGTVLRTYLLPETPTCLELDAADRYIYLGYESCSVQQLDLFDVRNGDESGAPIQPPTSSHWKAEDRSAGAVLSSGLSFDGTSLLTGHQSGAIVCWDASKGRFGKLLLQNPLPGPVNNLTLLPVTGFADHIDQKIRIPAVVKPKFRAFDSSNGEVPNNYSLNVDLPSALRTHQGCVFAEALTAPSFPQHLLDAGLAELAAWGREPRQSGGEAEAEDFVALDDDVNVSRKLTMAEQNEQLKQELEALRRVQKASLDKMMKMSMEKKMLLKRQQNGVAVNGVNGMNDSSDED